MTENEPDENSSGTDHETLEILREEAHRTIDRQRQTMNDIDTKAVKILRLNLVVVSLTLTGVSFLATVNNPSFVDRTVRQRLVNGYLLVGLFFVLLSTSVAALTYTASTTRRGLSGRDIETVLTNEHTSRENLAGIVNSYANWIRYNFRVNTRHAPLGTATVVFLTYGIVWMAVGVVHAAVVSVGPVGVVIVVAALVAFTRQTGIVRQLHRYQRYRSRDSSKES